MKDKIKRTHETQLARCLSYKYARATLLFNIRQTKKNYVHYEFLRIPFGLKTAPATFQRLINTALKDYIKRICPFYLVDKIIFSTSRTHKLFSINL